MAVSPTVNTSLKPYSGMATPAHASLLLEVNSFTELQQALRFAMQESQPLLLLGEGSNTVFIDDFEGLVVVNRLRGIEVLSDDENSILIEVAAGENWHKLVQYTLAHGWYGLQNLALIPGSVGAAPIQNIGAYGVEVDACIDSVTCLDVQTLKQLRLTREQCNFAYRDSIFKNQLAGKVAICAVRFRLPKSATCDVSYAALQDRFSDREPTPQRIFSTVCELRRQKLPLPSEVPNCGSFFKNPVVSTDKFKELQSAHAGIVGFAVADGVKLAAAWLIEQGGWKQRDLQGVTVYERQALVITNPEFSHGKRVLEYATAIQDDVLRRYRIHLEIEPQLY